MSGSTGRWESWGYALGLGLLYTSAFYLPAVGGPQSYWYPYVRREILFPTVVGTIILVPIARFILSRYLRAQAWNAIEQIPIAALALTALIGVFSAVGYSAADLAISLAGNDPTIDAIRWWRVTVSATVFVILAAGLAALKNSREPVVRVLATAGYAFAVLAMMRAGHSSTTPHLAASIGPAMIVPAANPRSASEPTIATRQVVWIIFDEMDYNQTLGSPFLQAPQFMPNLLSLSKLAISATRAYSPARDTEVSIPSLLLGVPPVGVRITRDGLSIHAHDGSFQPFDESHSVFSRLPGGPGSGAILGFYHPYCDRFPSITPCVAMPMGNVGQWFDALLPFGQPAVAVAHWLPVSDTGARAALLRAYEPMFLISEETTRQFPRFLSLQSRSLVYIHVNLPHPPGEYAQQALRLQAAADDREAYRRNLRLVDEMIGVTVSTLRAQAKSHDILLIMSSDHWHRIDSPHQMLPVPWVAWHVGEDAGASLDQQIGTVHTSELALDFIQGKVSRQQDILTWWQGKSFYPTLMPEHYGD
jgi:hypothetical protein